MSRAAAGGSSPGAAVPRSAAPRAPPVTARQVRRARAVRLDGSLVSVRVLNMVRLCVRVQPSKHGGALRRHARRPRCLHARCGRTWLPDRDPGWTLELCPSCFPRDYQPVSRWSPPPAPTRPRFSRCATRDDRSVRVLPGHGRRHPRRPRASRGHRQLQHVVRDADGSVVQWWAAIPTPATRSSTPGTAATRTCRPRPPTSSPTPVGDDAAWIRSHAEDGDGPIDVHSGTPGGSAAGHRHLDARGSRTNAPSGRCSARSPTPPALRRRCRG